MIHVSVVILEGAFPSAVAVTRDMLATAGALAASVGQPPLHWRACSPDGGAVALRAGMTIATERLGARPSQAGDIWVVPGLGLNTPDEISSRLSTPDAVSAAGALREHVAAGGLVAAGCSAVFLLHAAGLLESRRATTTWWLAPVLQAMAPTCRVVAGQMVCADGQITTAGAALAQADLMLHLFRRHLGRPLADAVASRLLASERQSQALFVMPEAMASGNELVTRLMAHIEATLAQPPSVAELASAFCMSERTLARHIQRATGESPLTLINRVKLRHARQLLESSRLTVDQIAAAVGYGDATALRRMMKKLTGVTPGQFRRQQTPF